MEVLSREKIFITGIEGFTGRYLEKYFLEQDFLVYGTCLHESEKENIFTCDILNENAIFDLLNEVNPDYIIHLAAISFVAEKNQKKIYDVNIFGTLNLLNAIEKSGCNPRKILIASSAAVYGNVEGVLEESMCPNPVNHYGNSKLVMENMVKQFYNRLNIIIVRPFNYTGTGQKNHFLIPKIVSHYKDKKEKIELGNIDVYREFNSVFFVIKCYNELLFSEIKSEVFNVCTGKEKNIRTILNTMNDIANYSIEVEVNPKFVRKNEIKMLKGSPDKLFQSIGDFTDEFSLEGTLRDMYEC
ncbi:GDP-mannose 4,6-dehydratase [Urechidicola vernalis]|uniref:GDP-mannose 4,6-dehydratase n=1 Tax=Urechidicola vernalis TaxID=3075600 RepID=A0ABU2Y7J2_9FLAO|nr:GDP-mannose 4,6-dehydratase [Urechidicola sp. P050]MDT0554165.1 GDP-mannose 4,6-dehydratase [Urechidicola sp. P050]